MGGTGPVDGEPLQCFVVGGAVTIYGSEDLSWVDPIVQDSLNEAMIGGQFDDGAFDERVIYVRFIPPDTVLNVTDGSIDSADQPRSDDGTPSWAWVLVAFGIFGLILCIIYLVLKRKQHQVSQEEFERRKQHADQYVSQNSQGDGAEDNQQEEGGAGNNAGNMDEQADLLR